MNNRLCIRGPYDYIDLWLFNHHRYIDLVSRSLSSLCEKPPNYLIISTTQFLILYDEISSMVYSSREKHVEHVARNWRYGGRITHSWCWISYMWYAKHYPNVWNTSYKNFQDVVVFGWTWFDHMKQDWSPHYTDMRRIIEGKSKYQLCSERINTASSNS